MSTHTEPERRKCPRYNVQIPIQLSLSHSSFPDALDATALNLCQNGLYCTVTRYIPPFHKLLITMIAPKHEETPPRVISQMEGVVVRVEPEQEEAGCHTYHVALFFQEISEEQDDALQSLLASHAAHIDGHECVYA